MWQKSVQIGQSLWKPITAKMISTLIISENLNFQQSYACFLRRSFRVAEDNKTSRSAKVTLLLSNSSHEVLDVFLLSEVNGVSTTMAEPWYKTFNSTMGPGLETTRLQIVCKWIHPKRTTDSSHRSTLAVNNLSIALTVALWGYQLWVPLNIKYYFTVNPENVPTIQNHNVSQNRHA